MYITPEQTQTFKVQHATLVDDDTTVTHNQGGTWLDIAIPIKRLTVTLDDGSEYEYICASTTQATLAEFDPDFQIDSLNMDELKQWSTTQVVHPSYFVTTYIQPNSKVQKAVTSKEFSGKATGNEIDASTNVGGVNPQNLEEIDLDRQDRLVDTALQDYLTKKEVADVIIQ